MSDVAYHTTPQFLESAQSGYQIVATTTPWSNYQAYINLDIVYLLLYLDGHRKSLVDPLTSQVDEPFLHGAQLLLTLNVEFYDVMNFLFIDFILQQIIRNLHHYYPSLWSFLGSTILSPTSWWGHQPFLSPQPIFFHLRVPIYRVSNISQAHIF